MNNYYTNVNYLQLYIIIVELLVDIFMMLFFNVDDCVKDSVLNVVNKYPSDLIFPSCHNLVADSK